MGRKSSELLITERELVHRLSLITGHNKDVVKDVLRAQTEFVTDELKNGIPVRLTGLGEFSVMQSTRGGGYDFQKKCVKPMVTVISPKFRISEVLRNAVKEYVEP